MDLKSLFTFAGKKPANKGAFSGTKATPKAAVPMSYAKPQMSVALKAPPKTSTPDERIRAIQQANEEATAKLKAENRKNVAANVKNAFKFLAPESYEMAKEGVAKKDTLKQVAAGANVVKELTVKPFSRLAVSLGSQIAHIGKRDWEIKPGPKTSWLLGKEPIKPPGQEGVEMGVGAYQLAKQKVDLPDIKTTKGKLAAMPLVLLGGILEGSAADIGIGGAGKTVAKEGAEKLLKEGAERLVKEGAEKLAKEEAEKLAKEGAERFLETAGKEAVEDIARPGLNQTDIFGGMVKESPLKPEQSGLALPPDRDALTKPAQNTLSSKEYTDAVTKQLTEAKRGHGSLVTPPEITEPDLSYQGKGTGSLRRTSDYGIRAHEVTDDMLTKAGKQRAFIGTAKGAEATAPVVAEKIQGSYDPLTNKDTLQRAVSFAKENPDEAMRIVKSPESKVNADNVALAQVMIQKAQSEGRYQDAIDIIESMAAHATEQGQAIQALSMWGRLTPEGALKYAQRLVDKANATIATKGSMSKIANKYKITPELAKEITDLAKRVQSLPPGREREIATAKLLDQIGAVVPVPFLRKVSTLQTMAQLLNPKTAIRNVIGNAGFAALENVSDVLGAGIDKAVSLATGRRTRAMPSLSKQATGLVQGAKLGFEDALKGVDTSAIAAGKFEMGRRTFRGKVLGNMEKALNASLKAPDRAFYESAYHGEMDNLERLVAAGKLEMGPEQMAEVAHYQALRRTFQDDNALSHALSGVKRGLNKLSTGGTEWGLGDIVMKYPKTPAALLMRGMEYTPVGGINVGRELYHAAMDSILPLVGGKVTAKTFDQRKFVDALSRSAIGTGAFFALGGALYANGILTGSKNEDASIADLERDSGMGEYRLNLSALKRWVMSGFNEKEAKPQSGDFVYSYDWAQPVAVSAAMGANYSKARSENQGAGSTLSGLAEGAAGMSDTLINQSLFTGVRRVLNAMSYGGSLQKALTDTAKDVPASFVPTLINQIKQLSDNTGRETYDPSVVQEAYNRVINRIPGASKTLPARSKLIGGERETYQDGSNNILNVMLNPGFASRIKESPEAKEVLDLFKLTGETKQLPRFAGKKVKLLNQEFVATAQQYADMQKYLGEQTKKTLDTLQANPVWDKLDDDKKVEYLGKQLSVVAKEAKAKTYMEGMGVTLPEKWPEVLKAKIGVAAITKAGKIKAFKAASKEQQARVLQAIVDQYDAALKARTASKNAVQ